MPTTNSFSYFYLSDQQQFVCFSKIKNAYAYYKSFRIDLTSGQKQNYSLPSLLENIEQVKVSDSFDHAHVYHLSYEFGYYSVGLEELIPESIPIAFELIYENSELISPKEKVFGLGDLLKVEFPKFKDYKEKFNKVYHELIEGNCYQVNLTEMFKIPVAMNEKLFKKIAFQKNQMMAPYGHGTFLPAANWAFISHSPECLFHLDDLKNGKFRVRSMPIKGTIKKLEKSQDQLLWQKLIDDPKEAAELNMITDLIRNDLARIDTPQSHVLKMKARLDLPGIIHQFSDISTEIPRDTSLNKVVKSLFPGGSITGAPKKNVMKIIKRIESDSRRFYCGSTIIFHKSMRKASINIRSAEFLLDEKQMLVGAGGGITLQSKVQDEFLELKTKFESIQSYFQVK